jgi:glycosyltransferase involved in cell wall biosynthesis
MHGGSIINISSKDMNGYLIPNKESDKQYINNIELILNNNDFYHNLIEKGYNQIVQKFNWNYIIKEYIEKIFN